MIKNMLLKEYDRRNEGYKVDLNTLDILTKMNNALEESEIKSDIVFDNPFIFSFGLPRSGTTVLSQLISSCFEVGYIDNIIARFWLAPKYGIELSKSLKNSEYQSDFSSNYAHTNIFEPHEFAYFWQKWLKKDTVEDYLTFGSIEKFDELGFKNSMYEICTSFNKPMSFKNILGANHMQKLNDVLGKVVWIYIKREPIDVIVSILEGREKYYGDINQWWSTKPAEYNDIKDYNGYEQVVAQVYYLNKSYEKQIEENKENCLIIDYKELCKNTVETMKKVEKKLFDLYGYKIKTRYEKIPAKLEFRQKDISNYDQGEIIKYYKKYFKEGIDFG